MTYSYSKDFYEEMKSTSASSARRVVALVKGFTSINSVVDVGCGTGVWLKEFAAQGAGKIQGFDGPWVEQDMLVIPKESFHASDLERLPDLFPTLGSRVDVAVCLEVAEHISDANSRNLIERLTAVAPVILFSAAIPHQDGSHHINEQWPDYWEKRFAERGYVPVDCIRRHVWQDAGVSFFYAQNILIYVEKAKLTQGQYPKLAHEIETGHGAATALVHPRMYIHYAERWKLVAPILWKFPPSFLHAAKKFLKKIRT